MKDHSLNPSISKSSLMLDGLSQDQQDRLIGLLDDYMIDMEEGRTVDAQSLVENNPDLEKPLRQYLEGLDWLGKFNRCLAPVAATGVADILIHCRFPSNFGDYDLGMELGRGAMGIVFAATQRSTGKPVAIKILAFGSSADKNRIERFKREAAAAQLLCHPNIVKVFDVGIENGMHYYSMQRVDGCALSNLIRRHHPLSEIDSQTFAPPLRSTVANHQPPINPAADRTLDFRELAMEFAAVADALHTAHGAGIIHRDIKPSNLLLDNNNHIWITDFGLAHVEQSQQLTRTGDLVGTFQYMSPEQASGKPEQIDMRTDIYSLGTTLYEYVSGKPPFAGFSGAALLKQIQSREPCRLCQLTPNVPRDLETIIRRAMRPDKNDRYASALEMSQDLRRFANGRHVLAQRVTLTEKATRFAAKNSSVVLAGLVLSGLCVAALIGHSLLLEREQLRTQQALVQSERNYQNARRVIDTFGSSFANRLTIIPGTESVRREVLAESLAYYQAFIDDANQDPRLANDVAETRLKIARLISQIGNSEDADNAYHEAIQSLQAAQAKSQTSIIATNLYHALHEYAMLASKQGRHATARERLTEAALCISHLKTDADRKHAEALLHNNLAIVSLRAGDSKKAVSESKKAVELLDKMNKEFGVNILDLTFSVELADSLSNLSVMLVDSGEELNAGLAAKAAIDLRKSIDRNSKSPDHLRRLALAYNNLAAIDWRQGKTLESIETYQQAIALLEKATQQLPGQSEPQNELSVTLNNLGMALSSLRQVKEAEKAFRRALAIATPSADADPKNADAAQRAAGIWNNLGVLLRNGYDIENARHAFENARVYQLRSCELSPQDRASSRILEQIQSNLVSVSTKPTS